MPASPARAAAFDILLRVERESSYASELLHSATYEALSTPDHALATELVMGVLRWRSCLDEEIATASSQSLPKLDLEVLIALRLALYQFRFLDRIPQRAALHESVELVKRARKRSAAPFVNAILRKLSNAAPAKPPTAEELSSPESLARAFAHPLWMVERWTHEYGLAAAHEICKHNQSIPGTAIRIRAPKAEAQVSQQGISLTRGSLLSSARRLSAGDITKTKSCLAGEIVIQDEASQLVAALVAPVPLKPGSRILDCCAAPGGKTLALADRNPQASIVAVELHVHRAQLMQRLLDQRLPNRHEDDQPENDQPENDGRDNACLENAGHEATVKRVKVVASDVRLLPRRPQFDRVLADVPCSGTGTLARHPEIKWRLTTADIAELHERQSAILRAALAQVAPGGRLIYSTCSLEKEENEDVVEQALAENHSFRLLDCRTELATLKTAGDLTWPNPADLTRGPYLRTIPGLHPCDGFFAAILERF